MFTKKRPEYEKIKPFSNYAPWIIDDEFVKTYEAIRESTLVDLYRCYELWSLVEQSAKLEGALLEVGVWRGGTGALMASAARLHNIQEPIYLCDTFYGVVKASCFDPLYRGGEHNDTSQEMVESLLQKLQLTNAQILTGIFPDETHTQINHSKFRLCHIDVDVYESAKDILDWLWDKLVIGGMVVFDDYGFESCGGITTLVNDFKHFKNVNFIHNLNGHGILIKRC